CQHRASGNTPPPSFLLVGRGWVGPTIGSILPSGIARRAKRMKTYTLPHTERTVSSVVLGLMRIAKMSDAEIATLFGAARDAGITVFDHADIYGGERHRCEQRFGEAVSLSAAERDAIFIQSKVGIRKGYFDFSKQHILTSVDESL